MISADQKHAAKKFLSGLERHLNSRLPLTSALAPEVAKIVREARDSSDKRVKAFAFPEGAVLNTYVVPNVSDYLTSVVGLTAAAARKALLSESHKTHSNLSGGSPSRSLQHPFTKVI